MANRAVADPKDEARRGFEGQMAAWNRGDLEGALKAYWADAGMTWVNKGGVERGFDAFAIGMRKDFADPSKMGHYAGEFLESRDLGSDSALIVVKWSITRDGKRIMGGVSTQIWRLVAGAWRIVFEHAS